MCYGYKIFFTCKYNYSRTPQFNSVRVRTNMFTFVLNIISYYNKIIKKI